MDEIDEIWLKELRDIWREFISRCNERYSCSKCQYNTAVSKNVGSCFAAYLYKMMREKIKALEKRLHDCNKKKGGEA